MGQFAVTGEFGTNYVNVTYKQVYSYHFGQDVHGQHFYRALPNYREAYWEPFLIFAEGALGMYISFRILLQTVDSWI